MGREVRRVPCDFDHPVGKTWSGFLTDPLIEPPHGEGFQLWENVSDGSPISPVFATPHDLAVWMSHNDCTVGGTMPYDDAMRFIIAGGAPTMVITDGHVVDGATWTGTAPNDT